MDIGSFVKLTRADYAGGDQTGLPAWVDSREVITVESTRSGHGTIQSQLHLRNSLHSLFVKETPEVVIDLILKARVK